MVRRNNSGRIYGITFIEHHSKTVWNGSGLGKEYAANVFQERWSGDGNFSKDKYNNRKIKSVRHDDFKEKASLKKFISYMISFRIIMIIIME